MTLFVSGTATAIRVLQGNYDVAMAIAYILLIITYTVIVLLTIPTA
ncbi:hypothetical protein [Nostoc sp.]